MSSKTIAMSKVLASFFVLSALGTAAFSLPKRSLNPVSPSARAFANAMESWKELNTITPKLEASNPSEREIQRTKSLLHKTLEDLQHCDRGELDRLYPGWGANRDLFLSAVFGYIQSLDREEVRLRDLRESNEKLKTFYSWVALNEEPLRKQLGDHF